MGQTGVITAGKEPGEYHGEYQDISQHSWHWLLILRISSLNQIGGFDCDSGPAGVRGLESK